jgi:hypothetical protein
VDKIQANKLAELDKLRTQLQDIRFTGRAPAEAIERVRARVLKLERETVYLTDETLDEGDFGYMWYLIPASLEICVIYPERNVSTSFYFKDLAMLSLAWDFVTKFWCTPMGIERGDWFPA